MMIILCLLFFVVVGTTFMEKVQQGANKHRGALGGGNEKRDMQVAAFALSLLHFSGSPLIM